MADEWLDVVDSVDRVVGRQRRQTVHRLGLLHRGAHAFLFDSGGRLLVQRRHRNLKSWPSALDCSVSEHVISGEEYDQAVTRGLSEELGLTATGFRPALQFRMVYGEGDNMISRLYIGDVQPAAVTPDPQEIEATCFQPVDRLVQMIDRGEDTFSRWFRELLLWYSNRPSDVQVIAVYPAAGGDGAAGNPR